MPTLPDVAQLIKALGTFAWPTVVLVLVLLFRSALSALLGNLKLKSAEILGQKVELEDRIQKGLKAVEAVPPRPADVVTPSVQDHASQEAQHAWRARVQREVFEVTRQVLAEAGRSPKAALMLLAAHIESELRRVLQETNAPVRPGSSWHDIVAFLRDREFPKELLDSIRTFLDIRNSVVHGREADDDDVLRAIDLGLRILNAIQAQRDPRTLIGPD